MAYSARQPGIGGYGFSEENRFFLQPLAIAAVSLVIGLLFLATAMLNSRRIESMLLEGLNVRAQSILQGIELLAARKFERLERLLQPVSSDPLSLDPLLEETFALREALAADLLAAAAEIDAALAAGATLEEALAKTLAPATFSVDYARGADILAMDAPDEKLDRQFYWLDEKQAQGETQGMAGRLPEALRLEPSGLLPPRDEITVRLWPEEHLAYGYVGRRRDRSGGAIFLFFEREGARRWALRQALREAAEEVGWREEVAHLILQDRGGRPMVSLGDVPEDRRSLQLPAPGAMQRSAGTSGDTLETARRIRFHDEEEFIARIGLYARPLDELVRDHRRHVYLSATLMVGLGLLSILLLAWNQNRHLRRIQELQRRLHQAERLSSLGQLAAAVAHEIRNPLNAVSLAIQRLQREAASGGGKPGTVEPAALLHTVRGEIRRLDRIVEDFLSLSRPGRLELRPVPLRGLLESLLALLGEEAQARAVALESAFPEADLVLTGDENRLRQALLNLLKNALEALPNGGTIRVSLRPRAPEGVEIEIHDTGVGIPAASLAAVFDPDYTTKPGGLGLGLPIALQILRAHGGELGIQSAPGRGTTCTVRLPLAGRG